MHSNTNISKSESFQVRDTHSCSDVIIQNFQEVRGCRKGNWIFLKVAETESAIDLTEKPEPEDERVRRRRGDEEGFMRVRRRKLEEPQLLQTNTMVFQLNPHAATSYDMKMEKKGPCRHW